MKEHQAGPQSYTDQQRWRPAAKHTTLATRREREEENKQAEQKRQHQKCSLGIKAKIPKKIRRPQSSAKIVKLGEKNATTAALRKASRRIGTGIVAVTDANATVALTNATEA